jgi:putative restriction endonuclease
VVWGPGGQSSRLADRSSQPSADHLFDRGFISFDDDGELLVSGVADVRSLKRMGADPDSPPSPLAFNRDQRHFLEFHRREVFLGAGS